ncbi:hypothetical protein GWK47_021816 [Chionoecetes opilio]|uniref:Uncharacterized protein n=1 Tax=Chionoecetes opilio TaxID=41210 RepID=A0A8J4XP55_CHIOP|nr:hypothetical protein GWK47_021816 [Chionoecetes opilio]
MCHLGLDSPVVTEDIVAHLLRTVNTKKAPGPDCTGQVKFAAEKTQAWLYHVRGRTPGYRGEAEVWGRYPCHQGLLNILGVEVDSRLRLGRHLETVARRASLRVTLLRRVRHLLDADGLMRLYKAQVRPVMKYSPLTWMSSAQCHLSLLDKGAEAC